MARKLVLVKKPPIREKADSCPPKTKSGDSAWPWSVYLFIYNWGRQLLYNYFLGFCCTTVWISHIYTYIPSLKSLLPTTCPPTPDHRRAPGWAPCAVGQLPTSYDLHMVTYKCQCYSLCLSHPLLPDCVYKSGFYVCISVCALHIGSTLLFFCIPYIMH